jgi:hypothetical protein
MCRVKVVMAGLVPAIHVLRVSRQSKTWMAGTSPGMTVERFSLAMLDLLAWH